MGTNFAPCVFNVSYRLDYKLQNMVHSLKLICTTNKHTGNTINCSKTQENITTFICTIGQKSPEML